MTRAGDGVQGGRCQCPWSSAHVEYGVSIPLVAATVLESRCGLIRPRSDRRRSFQRRSNAGVAPSRVAEHHRPRLTALASCPHRRCKARAPGRRNVVSRLRLTGGVRETSVRGQPSALRVDRMCVAPCSMQPGSSSPFAWSGVVTFSRRSSIMDETAACLQRRSCCAHACPYARTLIA